MLSDQVFNDEMTRVAQKTRDDLDMPTRLAYQEEFEDWTDEGFTVVMRLCGREFNRFPTVAQIVAMGRRVAAEVRRKTEQIRLHQESVRVDVFKANRDWAIEASEDDIQRAIRWKLANLQPAEQKRIEQ